MEAANYLYHPDMQMDSDTDDSDYQDSIVSPQSSDYTMSTATSSHTHNSSASSIPIIHPHDSISNRGGDSPPSEASDVSVLPLTSDNHLYRTLHGRAFNTQSDMYMLPADGAEHSRLDVQHQLLKYNLNSLYAPVALVKRAMAPSSAWEPAVLDIGTGSGKWAIDIALEFPHAKSIGLDLVPPTLPDVGQIPSNCRFEIDDANLSLSHYADCFNVVHMRAADAGINDFESFLYNIAQTLRPEGVLLLCTGSPQFYGERKEPLPVVDEGQPGFSWLQHTFAAFYTAYMNRGTTSVDSSLRWHRWLESNPNYENVVTHDVYIPLGPWIPGMDERQTYVSELMRYDIIHCADSYKPLLLSDGYYSDIVDRWVLSAQEELRELRVHAYVKWRYTWAVRTKTPWMERMEEHRPIEEETRRLGRPRNPNSLTGSESSGGSINSSNPVSVPGISFVR